jgi:uncharacterized membrane protein YfcA
MLPTVLVGSLIGIYINEIFPAPVLEILLSLLLIFLSQITILKAKIMYLKEKK